MIIFDLDGTLIDSSERMYRLFQKLIPDSKLTKEQYWNLKRNKINHQMILEKYFPQYDFDSFNSIWLEQIELDEYLNMDCNYPDTIKVLTALCKNREIVLLTARQSKERLYSELERLELKQFFSHILVTETNTTKDALLKEVRLAQSANDLFVSDMGKDILIGKSYGYLTVGITHGFMNEEKLAEYLPDYLISDLNQLFEVIHLL